MLLVSLSCATRAQPPAPIHPAILQHRLQSIAASFPGTVGIFARNLETGAEVSINPDQQFPMASTYKIAIMVHIYREVDAGRISLTERVPLKESDRRLGSGLLTFMTPGLDPTIHDLLLLMITVSDNEATDLLLGRVGAANVTETLRSLGIRDMRVDRSTQQLIADWLGEADPRIRTMSAAAMLSDTAAFANLTREQLDKAGVALRKDPRDQTSPRAMADLLSKIVTSEAASEKSCRDMLEIMGNQQLRTRIHRYLEDVPIASKNGTIGETTNDVGVLSLGAQHIVLSVFTQKASSDVRTEQAEEFIGRIARAVYDYAQDTSTQR